MSFTSPAPSTRSIQNGSQIPRPTAMPANACSRAASGAFVASEYPTPPISRPRTSALGIRRERRSDMQAATRRSVRTAPPKAPTGVPPKTFTTRWVTTQGAAAGACGFAPGVSVISSRMLFHHKEMSFRKAVRIAIRPTATIASRSPYSAIAAPSSSRRKRRTPCIMRFMRELLEKMGGTCSGLRRRRRNAAECRSQRRTSHDRAAVSGGKGRCKESTHHPEPFALVLARFLMLHTGAVEQVFQGVGARGDQARYGRRYNDLRSNARAGFRASARPVSDGRGVRSAGARALAQAVDWASVCRACTTGDDANHHAPARTCYTSGWLTPSVGRPAASHPTPKLLGSGAAALSNTQAGVHRCGDEKHEPGGAAEDQQRSQVPGVAVEIRGKPVGDVDARPRGAKHEGEGSNNEKRDRETGTDPG